MEVPIQMALDTTEGWNRGDAALLDGELGIEVYTDKTTGVEHRYLLAGDGKLIAGNVERLRAPPEFIAELPGEIRREAGLLVGAEAEARKTADEELKTNIEAEAEARKTADDVLQTKIEAEAAARIAADEELEEGLENLSSVTNDAQVKRSEMGQPNGVATLDNEGKVPKDQIPAVPVDMGINRAVTTNDDAIGPAHDDGGNLSIPIPVTVPAGDDTDTLPSVSTASLRSWLSAIRNNVSRLFNGKVDKINAIAGITTPAAKKIAHNAQGQITGTADLTPNDIGLGSVANIDLSSVTNDAQVKRSEMGQPNGVALLDANGQVPQASVSSLFAQLAAQALASPSALQLNSFISVGASTFRLPPPPANGIYIGSFTVTAPPAGQGGAYICTPEAAGNYEILIYGAISSFSSAYNTVTGGVKYIKTGYGVFAGGHADGPSIHNNLVFFVESGDQASGIFIIRRQA